MAVAQAVTDYTALLERCEVAEGRVKSLCDALTQAHRREARIGGYMAPEQQQQLAEEQALIVEIEGTPKDPKRAKAAERFRR